MRLADSCVASCFNMHSFWCFPGAGIPGRKGAKLLRRHERERSGIQLAFWRHVPSRNFGIPSHPYHCYQCWPIACFLLVGWRDVWFHASFLTSFYFILFHPNSNSIVFVCLHNTLQIVKSYELLWIVCPLPGEFIPKSETQKGPLFPVLLLVPPHRGWQTSRLQRCNFWRLDRNIKTQAINSNKQPQT